MFVLKWIILFAYIVMKCCVTARLGQQQLDYLHMAMLTGTHERCGTLIVLDVDISATGQQCLHHVHPAMTDCQHQPRLTSLEERVKGITSPKH